MRLTDEPVLRRPGAVSSKAAEGGATVRSFKVAMSLYTNGQGTAYQRADEV
jgi:hypothetical protein